MFDIFQLDEDIRNATLEEQKSETDYIMSISCSTGITFDDITKIIKYA